MDITCTDDYPSGKTTISVNDIYSSFADSGPSPYFKKVSLIADDGSRALLEIKCYDPSYKQTVLKTMLLWVDSSKTLREIETVRGFIHDFDSTRVLFDEETASRNAKTGKVEVRGVAKIFDRVKKTTTVLVQGGLIDPTKADLGIEFGCLSPVGAVYLHKRGEAWSVDLLDEWRSGKVTTLAKGYISDSDIHCAGQFLVWRNYIKYTYIKMDFRDMGKGTTATIGMDITDADVADNGDVCFEKDPSGGKLQIFLYRNGKSTRLTNTKKKANSDCQTDGKNIMFIRRDSSKMGSKVVLHTGSGEENLNKMLVNYYDARDGCAVNNGWAAYTDRNAMGTLQVWLRSPTGKKTQVTYWGTDSELMALGANGDIVVHNDNTSVGYAYLIEYGSKPKPMYKLWHKPRHLGGKWYVAVGRSLFEVTASTGTPDAGIQMDSATADASLGDSLVIDATGRTGDGPVAVRDAGEIVDSSTADLPSSDRASPLDTAPQNEKELTPQGSAEGCGCSATNRTDGLWSGFLVLWALLAFRGRQGRQR